MIIILIALGFIFLLFLGAGLFVVLYATTRRDRTELFKSSTIAPSGRLIYKESVEEGVKWFENQKYESISILSHDNLSLKAILLRPSHPVATVIALHGFRSWPSREFAGVAKLLYDNNIAVLYPYQRSHRISEGHYITFGVKEKSDCAQWAFVMSDIFPDLPLFLYGQSMGGATVLMAGSVDLPVQVKGVIADSAYNSPAAVIINLLKKSYHIPPFPLVYFVDFWTMLLGHYGLFRNGADKCMRPDLKYLFIHGDIDDLIPFSMGKSNFDACPSLAKSFLTVKGAGHCACCYKNKTDYNNALIQFIKNTI